MNYGVLVKAFLIVSVFIFICEYAIYPIVLYRCSWPDATGLEDGESKDDILKAIFIADTHLLGPIWGHWFDKLRREWQMQRAFQTAIEFFKPDVIFFLGDLLDEGEWVNEKEFGKYVSRFRSLFKVPPQSMGIYIVPGNHDTGFHNNTSPSLTMRFQKAFNTTPVQLLRLKKVNFVLINSMAMEIDGDDCFLYREAIKELNEIQEILNCQKDINSEKCSKSKLKDKVNFQDKLINKEYSLPVILQHFPMYRESDAICSGEAIAPLKEKEIIFQRNIDCLSENSTDLLLRTIQPRLIMSGHTHHYCYRNHSLKGGLNVSEYSIPSFNWRNRNDPSFFLGLFTKDNYRLSKCNMPKETTVIVIYLVGLSLAMYVILAPLLKWFFKLGKRLVLKV